MDKRKRKNEIRTAMLQTRDALAEEYISRTEKESLPVILSFLRQIHTECSERLLCDDGSCRPLTVMSYMSFRNEFPTRRLNRRIIDEGFRLVLPYTDPQFQITAFIVEDPDQLKPSPLGIPEPDFRIHQKAHVSDIDVILMPGVAFDPAGNRIGFGKGCYDRFLSDPSFLPVTAALAYDFQLTGEIPAEPGDVACRYLLHQGKMIRAAR
ncbi:MAG: 5-formyltetrahydrofolate cyclo-ligase [Anaerovoracaceae bacterium]